MMKHNKLFVTFSTLVGLLAGQVQALEVDRTVAPRISLGGQVMGTVDYHDMESNPDAENEFNLDDSSLLLGFDKRLYAEGVAGAVLGLTNTHEGAVFHQLHVFYWDLNTRWELGRGRLPNSLIEFPTMRDDDLLVYTHVGNASSNQELDQIYGEYLSFDWFVDRKNQRVKLWSGTRRNSRTGAPVGFDSLGMAYIYEQSEDLRYVSRLRHAGLLLDRQQVSRAGNDEWMNALIAGADLNLNMNPAASWSLGFQAIANQGLDNAASVEDLAEQAQARSTAVVTGVRYTQRPQLLTRWQAGITLGHKSYADMDDAKQWTLMPSFFYRIGQGVDLLAQAAYTRYSGGLGGGSDKTVQVGMVFRLDGVFNDTIGERNSILNLEHGYIQ